MTTDVAVRDRTDLGVIRCELDRLTEARFRCRWDDNDRTRYRQLCQREQALLVPLS